jgi:Protein of unknown function (DUF2846)
MFARFRSFFALGLVLSLSVMVGCASVPMASKELDAKVKTFAAPSDGKAGLYIFRDSMFGAALTKTVSLDGKVIGATAGKTFFYTEVQPGSLTLATQSEFSDNSLGIAVQSGKNYFVRQFIKMGVFVGGANLELVDEKTGKEAVLQCELAAPAPGAAK